MSYNSSYNGKRKGLKNCKTLLLAYDDWFLIECYLTKLCVRVLYIVILTRKVIISGQKNRYSSFCNNCS
jgi:hypothetical protein